MNTNSRAPILAERGCTLSCAAGSQLAAAALHGMLKGTAGMQAKGTHGALGLLDHRAAAARSGHKAACKSSKVTAKGQIQTSD
jgi:hypothetical protein